MEYLEDVCSQISKSVDGFIATIITSNKLGMPLYCYAKSNGIRVDITSAELASIVATFKKGMRRSGLGKVDNFFCWNDNYDIFIVDLDHGDYNQCIISKKGGINLVKVSSMIKAFEHVIVRAITKMDNSRIDNLLSGLERDMEGINGCMLVNDDGSIFTSRMLTSYDFDASSYGCMISTTLNLVQNCANIAKQGELEGFVSKSKNGYSLSVRITDGVFIIALTSPEVNLGRALLKLQNVADQIQPLIRILQLA